MLITCMFWFTGCEWEPDRSNPLDPDNPYYQGTGNLRLKVYPLSWYDDPIPGVTVLINQLSRFDITDSTGEVFFDHIQADTLIVFAYRNGDSEVVYALDSIEVIIEPGKTTFDSLRLDAMPIFDSTKVNSVTIVEVDDAGDDLTKVTARLKAWVNDPDGIRDLARVEYDFFDMSDDLHYNPDSLYYQLEIPSEYFPGGNLRNTILQPFTFKAFDQAGNSSETTSLLARVINGYPRVYSIVFPETMLKWNYSLYNQLPDSSKFNFLIRIFKTDINRTTVYEKMVVPSSIAYNEHTIETELNPGTYSWQVWVIDLFGNMSRSKLGVLEVGPPL